MRQKRSQKAKDHQNIRHSLGIPSFTWSNGRSPILSRHCRSPAFMESYCHLWKCQKLQPQQQLQQEQKYQDLNNHPQLQEES